MNIEKIVTRQYDDLKVCELLDSSIEIIAEAPLRDFTLMRVIALSALKALRVDKLSCTDVTKPALTWYRHA